MTLPQILSLFSGVGGLDLGFRNVGFDVKLAIDRMPSAIETHQRNFPDTRSLVADLIELGPEGVIEEFTNVVLPGSSVAIIGGPPCQGFSRANARSDPSDPRNKLLFLYLDLVKAIQELYRVEFVILENVTGLQDKKHSQIFREMLEQFSDLGFATNIDVYCTLDFGVPQKRNRLIVAGFRSEGEAVAFRPIKRQRQKLTVKDAIAGLPQPAFFERGLDRGRIPHHPNHWTMQPRSKRFENPDIWQSSGRSFRRLDWSEPSPTVAYGNREIHVHPSGTRRLSIYEAMKLQGFPDQFVLEGSLSNQVEQISNAVPPPFATALAKAASKALDFPRVKQAS